MFNKSLFLLVRSLMKGSWSHSDLAGSLVFTWEFLFVVCGGGWANYLAICTEGKQVWTLLKQRWREVQMQKETWGHCAGPKHTLAKKLSKVWEAAFLLRDVKNFQFQHEHLLLDLFTPTSPDADDHFTLCFSPRHVGHCTLHWTNASSAHKPLPWRERKPTCPSTINGHWACEDIWLTTNSRPPGWKLLSLTFGDEGSENWPTLSLNHLWSFQIRLINIKIKSVSLSWSHMSSVQWANDY